MNSLPPMDINIHTYAVVDKVVKINSSGKSGYVYLPKTWAGKRIRICLMDELDEIE